MKKKENIPHKFISLSALHNALGLPAPLHPLISFINNENNEINFSRLHDSNVMNFYKILFSTKLSGKEKYGHTNYDFDQAGMLFAAPGQLIGGADHDEDHPDYFLLIDADFFSNHPKAEKIKGYGLFFYTVNEALHLSGKEKTIVLSVFRLIESELNSGTDEFSRDIIVTQIELLLNYCVRFYKRQFIIRNNGSSELMQRINHVLNQYFNDDQAFKTEVPTLQHLSEQLNFSPSYLSDMLRCLTGQSAQQHIRHRIIDRATESLSTTNLQLIAIAYELVFEHPQSLSTLFKIKTELSPLAFRRSLN